MRIFEANKNYIFLTSGLSGVFFLILLFGFSAKVSAACSCPTGYTQATRLPSGERGDAIFDSAYDFDDNVYCVEDAALLNLIISGPDSFEEYYEGPGGVPTMRPVYEWDKDAPLGQVSTVAAITLEQSVSFAYAKDGKPWGCMLGDRFTLARNTSGIKISDTSKGKCCPQSWYPVERDGDIVCCPSGYYDVDQRSGSSDRVDLEAKYQSVGGNMRKSDGTPNEWLINENFGLDPLFRVTSYACKRALTAAEKAALGVTHDDIATFSLGDAKVVDLSKYIQECVPGTGAITITEGCEIIEDPDEQKLCNDCESQTDPAGEKIYVWTEIGCVEATGSGIITRVFQIAVGIMGAVIILRIIQVVIILNNPNPSQDSIGEAREIIISIIVFAVFLGGGIIILRFLGYNVIKINVPIFG